MIIQLMYPVNSENIVLKIHLFHWCLKKKLPVLVGPLLAIQLFSHQLTLNFPWSLSYIRKLAFGSPWGNYFTPGFVYSLHTAPWNIKFAQTPPSQGTNSHIVERSLGDVLCPEKFMLGQCRIQATDLSICSRTCHHWTNVSHFMLMSLVIPQLSWITNYSLSDILLILFLTEDIYSITNVPGF